MRGSRRGWSALQGQRCRRLVICTQKNWKKVWGLRAPRFCQWDGHSWELVLGALDIISNQHAQQTVGKHDWWQAGHPLKTALENPSGSRQYVAVPCSWTPTLPPVGDDTWSMVLFPYDLNKFSPKHKIGHLCASLSAEEKHLDWSEREGFWFLEY